MDVSQKLAQLTGSAQFKEWHKTHKSHILAHAFVLLDDANKDTVQFGFLDPSEKKITTWYASDTIKHTQGEEVLESGAPILKLAIDTVTIGSDEALTAADDLRTKEYKGETVLKKFFILQTIDDVPTYNITFFTQSFSTINVKIDATNGKILHHNKQKLMEFG